MSNLDNMPKLSQDHNDTVQAVVLVDKKENTELVNSVRELTTVIEKEREQQKDIVQSNKNKPKGAIRWIGQKSIGHVKNHTSRHLGKEFKKEGLRFFQITKADIHHLDQVSIEAKKQKWLDELRVPFRMTMRELGVYSEDIEEKLHGLLMAHAICSVACLYIMYLLLTSVIALMLGDGAILYSLNMLLFFGISFTLWLMYSYHCWVFRCDRYGSLKHFIFDLKCGAVSIYFPYLPDCQEYHSDANFSDYVKPVVDENV